MRPVNRWLSGSSNVSATVRLFCLPYAGGGASIYYNWQAALYPDVEVLAVQLPGRENRILEKPYTDMKRLVNDLARVIQAHSDLPFAFFGHSMGALLAFQLACGLRRRGAAEPFHLFLSGYKAPSNRVQERFLHLLPDTELLLQLRQLNGTPTEFFENKEWQQLMLPVIRADFAICETFHHEPQPPLQRPIFVYGGMDDDEVSLKDLHDWRHFTSSDFQVQLFPGDHFYLRGPAEGQLLKALYSKLTINQKNRL